MLKRKGQWRSWLGLRGEVWYYTDQQTDRRDALIKIMQAAVPIVALLVTGFLSYRSLEFNKDSFIAQHRSKLSVEPVGYDSGTREDLRKGGLSVRIFNTGDSDALDVKLFGTVLWEGNTKEFVIFRIASETIKPGASASDIAETGLSKRSELIMARGTIAFKNAARQEQGPQDFCFMYSETTGPMSCK